MPERQNAVLFARAGAGQFEPVSVPSRAMAADMLVSSRPVDGAKDPPEDGMVTEFRGGMDTARVVPPCP